MTGTCTFEVSSNRSSALAAAALVLGVLATPRTVNAEASSPVLQLSSSDGDSSIRFQLAAQIRWEFDNTDRGPDRPAEQENSIFFRRLRAVISGSLVSEDFTYKLHFNLVPGALELIDLWIDYRFHRHIAVRLGQDKIPFTRYRLGSFSTRPVLEWSTPTRYFGAERQIGVMVHNGVGRPPRFEYQLGIATGVNARASNGVAMPLVFGAERPNPSDLTDPSAPSSFHPELIVHVAYNHADIDTKTPQDFDGGPPRFSVGLSAAWDVRPEPRQDLTLRVAPEVVLKVRGFTLWTVFYLGFWDEVSGTEQLGLGLLGGVAQASFVFLDRYEVGLRYTNVSILRAMRADARRDADGRIDEAEDDASREALAQQLSSVGLVRAEHEVTVGFSVYLFGRSLKLGVDGGPIIHQRTDQDRIDALVRLQAQLTF